ncbi:MAG: type II toxin-antitoxin system VapB family antitoxin [Armatimonadota bacterium]|nr:type II toxin-antitoxin system VapB family antitoxin [Armatimonadota bacterium]
MQVEVNVNEELLEEAKKLTGMSDTREVLEEGLRKLIRAREFAERLERRREAFLAALRSGASREEAQKHADRY